MNKHAKSFQLPRGERGSFTLDPMTSPTLPSRYYTDESIYRAEMRQIHQKSWCYVGHVCDVAEPGMYFTDVVGEQPVLVVKGQDGEIRAFYNVCQHRGHELLKGAGQAQDQGHFMPLSRLALPAGRHASGSADDRESEGLRQVAVRAEGQSSLGIAAGLIFVNLDPQRQAVR